MSGGKQTSHCPVAVLEQSSSTPVTAPNTRVCQRSSLGTSRSELIRRGAQAVLDAEQLASADRELKEAYLRQPADPALLQSARRLAAETTPAW